MKKYFVSALIILLGALCLYFYFKNASLQNQYYNALDKPADTIFVPKPYKVIEIKYVAKPVLVEVYKPDTLLRDSLEKGNLITGIEIKDGFLSRRPKLKIHTITPQGSVLVRTYDANDFKEIKINPQGETQIKRKNKLIKRAAIATIATGIVSSIFIYKNIKK